MKIEKKVDGRIVVDFSAAEMEEHFTAKERASGGAHYTKLQKVVDKVAPDRGLLLMLEVSTGEVHYVLIEEQRKKVAVAKAAVAERLKAGAAVARMYRSQAARFLDCQVSHLTRLEKAGVLTRVDSDKVEYWADEIAALADCYIDIDPAELEVLRRGEKKRGDAHVHYRGALQ